MTNEKKYINRPIVDKLITGFQENRIIIILGSRQVGKTSAMHMLRQSIKGHKLFFFNLEDIMHLKVCSDIESLTSYLKDNGTDVNNDPLFLIIDEFQYINNATKLFKQIYDLHPNVKILASGSSTIEIQKHLKESLAGRKRVYNLYSLSFNEFLRFKNEHQKYQKIDYHNPSKAIVDDLNKGFLDEFLLFGGYPRIALIKNKDEKIEELKDIYNSYIQKDIKALIKGENISAYNNLLSITASQIGNLLNIHELANTLNMKRSQVINYLETLEQTFILKTLKPFSGNKRTEISKMPKIYFYDNGIVNFATGNFGPLIYRENIGSLIENFVLNEIIRTIPAYYKIYFWRTKLGSEIDFILEGGGELLPIEVKWRSVNKPFVPKNISSFASKYKGVKKAVILTKNLSAKTLHNDIPIYFIPVVLANKFLKELAE